MSPLVPTRLAAALAHTAALAAALLLLLVAAQPLWTDDAWWHLALGRAFAAAGPWLAEDPLLFAAAGPPSASAWGFDVALYRVYELAGFTGLRALHVALVALDLGLAWALVFRASGSAVAASAGSVAFVALAAYRLAQLRPHLLTIALALGLLHLLVVGARSPSARHIAAAAGLMALWANLHAAFPLGLVLLGAAALGAAAPVALGRADLKMRSRARRLGWAWLAGLAATLCNPAGYHAHLAWFAAGASTPSLGRVMDEWAPLNPFAWPQPTLPPSPLAWLVVWALLVGLALLVPRAVAALRGAPDGGRLDPALVAVSAASAALLLGAVRFLWLGIVPIALLACLAAPRIARPAATWGLALMTALGVAGFLRWGDWPVVTRGLPGSAAQWAQPYPARKYYVEPLWIARDAGLEGRLHIPYNQAGFAGFWLAPRIRALTNGTLNVPEEMLRAAAALERRVGTVEVEGFAALLDHLGLDLFVGIRLPETGNPFRPWAWTTGHLDDTPGWIPLFRNLDSSLFLRDAPRNRANLERVERLYAERGVPFDPETGFDALRVAREAPEWATARGVVPRGFAALEHQAQHASDTRGANARQRLAALYTALGAHAEAVALDGRLLDETPHLVRARRRLVWNLLQLGRGEQARKEAASLAERPTSDRLSRALARLAEDFETLSREEARARLAALPVFRRAELPWLLSGMANPTPRTR